MTLALLALIVAVIARTVTQEEVFRELKEYCQRKSAEAPNIFGRKFFYLFTCQYCFSHWVALGVVILSGFRLWDDGIAGVIFSVFVLVGIANLYLALYERLTVATKEARERITMHVEGHKHQQLVYEEMAARVAIEKKYREAGLKHLESGGEPKIEVLGAAGTKGFAA